MNYLNCLDCLLNYFCYVKIKVEECFAGDPESQVFGSMSLYINGIEADIFYHFLTWDEISAIYPEILREETEARVDIEYHYQKHTYRAIITKERPIVFPLYDTEELKKYLSETDVLTPVLYAEKGEVEITDLVHSYAGPKHNFHGDVLEGVRVAWIRPDIPSETLELTDGELQDHVFTNNDFVEISLSEDLTDVEII